MSDVVLAAVITGSIAGVTAIVVVLITHELSDKKLDHITFLTNSTLSAANATIIALEAQVAALEKKIAAMLRAFNE